MRANASDTGRSQATNGRSGTTQENRTDEESTVVAALGRLLPSRTGARQLVSVGLTMLVVVSTVTAGIGTISGTASATGVGDADTAPAPGEIGAANLGTAGLAGAAADGSSTQAEAGKGGRDSQPALQSISHQSNGNTTLSGRVMFEAPDGSLEPARQVDIKVRHDVVGPVNPVLYETTTDDNGRYSVEMDVEKYEADVDFDNTLFLHVQALAENPAVEVEHLGQNLDTANGDTWTISESASVEVGQHAETVDLTADDSVLERRAFQVANWSLEAYRYTDDETGWTRRQARVLYPTPDPSTDQYQSPLDKFVIGNESWRGKRHTVHHEYAHATMGGLYDYGGWKIPNHLGSHCIWSDTGRYTAWNEGFAAFFEAAVNDSPRTDGMWLENHVYYDETNTHSADCPGSNANDGYDGAEVEGAVANIFWDIYDPANEPHDEINGSLDDIYDAINETDNSPYEHPMNNQKTIDIHDFFIQYVDNTGQHEELRKIYFEYGIVKPDRFDAPQDEPAVGACLVEEYPCEKMAENDWAELDDGASIDAGLYTGDDDAYYVEAEKDKWVTASAVVTGGETELEMDAYAGKPPFDLENNAPKKMSSGIEVGQNTSTSFKAPQSGYYTIILDNKPASAPQGTYTFNVSVSDSRPGAQNHQIPKNTVGTGPCPFVDGDCTDLNVSVDDLETESNGSSTDALSYNVTVDTDDLELVDNPGNESDQSQDSSADGTDAGSGSDSDAGSGSDSDAGSGSDSDGDSGSDAGSGSDSDGDSGSDAGSGSDSDGDSGSDGDAAQTGSDTDSSGESTTTTQDSSDTEQSTDSDGSSDADPEPEESSDADPEPEESSDAEPEPEESSDADPEPEPEIEDDPSADTDRSAERDEERERRVAETDERGRLGDAEDSERRDETAQRSDDEPALQNPGDTGQRSAESVTAEETTSDEDSRTDSAESGGDLPMPAVGAGLLGLLASVLGIWLRLS